MHRMKKLCMRYFAAWAICALLILAGCEKADQESVVRSSGNSAGSESTGDAWGVNSVEVSLVMDTSGSMTHSDEDEIAIEGAKMFIDLEKASHSGASLVTFADKASATASLALDSPENKAYLKSRLDEIRYGGYTDTGAALLQAVKTLDDSEQEADKKVIVLFTDGCTDVDEKASGRTLQQSRQDVKTAVGDAAAKGYRIYCIGLNSDGSVDEKELADISLSTGGKYHIAYSVEELTDFFNEIFMEIGNVSEQAVDEFEADGDWRRADFEITNDNAMEANVVIFSGVPLEDFKLVDPEGEEVSLSDSDAVYYSASDTYTILKIFNPYRGQWSVYVKGAAGDHIKITLLYSYEMNLVVDVYPTSMRKGTSVRVEASLMANGKHIDPAFYQNMTGVIRVEQGNSAHMEQALELHEKTDHSLLDGWIRLDETGEYQLTVHVEGNGLYRDSDPVTLTITKDPAILTKDFGEIELIKGKEKRISLDSHFSDPEGEAVRYRLEKKEGSVTASVEDGQLVLKDSETGSSELLIFADNGCGRELEVAVHITCVTAPVWVVTGIAAALLLLIAVLLAVILLKRGHRLSGVFEVELHYVQKSEAGGGRIESFAVFNPIRAASVGKRGFRMSELLSLVESYYSTGDEQKRALFEEAAAIARADAGKIRVKGMKEPFTLLVTKKNCSAKLMSSRDVISGAKRMKVTIRKNAFQKVASQDFAVRFIRDESCYVQLNVKYKMG